MVLRLVKQKFPDQDPIDLVVGWIKELAATKIFGSREPNVLGIGEFDATLHLVVPGDAAIERILETDDAIGILAQARIAFAIGCLRCGQRPRPWSSVRGYLQITQVDANHWLGIVQRHKGGNPGPEISALSTVALVTQATHEAMPQTGDMLIVHAHLSGPIGKPVTRHRGDDYIEGIFCAPTMSRGIGQWIDDLHLLNDRPGPSVGDDERQRILMFRANVDEMNVQPIDLRDEIR